MYEVTKSVQRSNIWGIILGFGLAGLGLFPKTDNTALSSQREFPEQTQRTYIDVTICRKPGG